MSTPKRAWVVWGVAVAAYAVAVFQRASLGVAGVEAQERFGATAAQLALFSVLQLAVYAGLQVPVGVLLDLRIHPVSRSRLDARRLADEILAAITRAEEEAENARSRLLPGLH